MISKFDFFAIARIAFNPLAFSDLMRFNIDMGGGDTVSAREMSATAKEEFLAGQERLKEYDPYFKEALEFDSKIAEENRARSADQWGQYTELYRPVEDKAARDALDWDSPASLDRAAQEGEALAARSSAAARGTTERAMQSLGVNPNSGRYAGAMMSGTIGDATLRANAANVGREQRRNTAVGLRENVSRIGRNLTATGLSADQVALGGAGQITGTTNSAIGARGLAASGALPWQQMVQQENARKAQLDAGNSAGMGSLVGTALGAMISSSEDVKEDKESVNASLILEGLEEIPVEAWKYKSGKGDGGRHIGPYAEDVQAQFGDEAAPGGEMIDMVSMNGIALAGIQALAKKVRKLEKASGGLDMARAKRDTEPRRVA